MNLITGLCSRLLVVRTLTTVHNTRIICYHVGWGSTCHFDSRLVCYEIGDSESSSSAEILQADYGGPRQNFNGQSYSWKNSGTLLIFATVMSSAMFIWDYLLTFRMEVDLVWKSRWNLTKALYLLQRYLPFIDTVWLVLYRQSDAFSIFLYSFFRRSNGGKFNED